MDSLKTNYNLHSSTMFIFKSNEFVSHPLFNFEAYNYFLIKNYHKVLKRDINLITISREIYPPLNHCFLPRCPLNINS